jgi:hypothetical protein
VGLRQWWPALSGRENSFAQFPRALPSAMIAQAFSLSTTSPVTTFGFQKDGLV